jgi:hypothetical protein
MADPAGDAARAGLTRAVLDFGRSLGDDPEQFRSVIADYCPHAESERAALEAAVAAGVPAELRRLGGLNGEQRDRLSQKLESSHQLEAETARWAVETWALALGVPVVAGGAAAASVPRKKIAKADDLSKVNPNAPEPMSKQIGAFAAGLVTATLVVWLCLEALAKWGTPVVKFLGTLPILSAVKATVGETAFAWIVVYAVCFVTFCWGGMAAGFGMSLIQQKRYRWQKTGYIAAVVLGGLGSMSSAQFQGAWVGCCVMAVTGIVLGLQEPPAALYITNLRKSEPAKTGMP